MLALYGQKQLKKPSKYLLLCSAEEQAIQRERVNDDKIIFG